MFAFKKYHIFKNIQPSLHVNKDKMDPLANLSGINIDRIDNLINKFFITLKGCDLQTAIEHINEVKELSERERAWLIEYVKRENEVNKLERYETCQTCGEMCLSQVYCIKCIRGKLQDDFKLWTSGNKGIDEFIQKCQLQTRAPDKIFEWIPFKEFENIKPKIKGGFGTIYTADWIHGSISHWDRETRSFCRIGTANVILKSLDNSSNLSEDLNESGFFQEIATHFHLLLTSDRLSWCLGVTRDDRTKDFMFVLSNKKRGDLGRYIRAHPQSLTWRNKLHILADLAEAVTYIHKENYVHKDLHPGNILLEDDCNGCHLSDLGLCRPVCEKREDKVYGVLPYMAPEVLNEKIYTIKSDIYALGIIMWVLVTERVPFGNKKHDSSLMLKIYSGQRPKSITGIPKEYVDLMERCWNDDPEKRPTAEEVYDYAKSLLYKMYDEGLKLENLFKPVVEAEDEAEFEAEFDESRRTSRLISFSYSLKCDFKEKGKVDDRTELSIEDDDDVIFVRKVGE